MNTELIIHSDRHWSINGPVNLSNVWRLMQCALRQQPLPRRSVLDLSAVNNFDTSLFALVFGLVRAFDAQGGELQLAGLSTPMMVMAEVHGCRELLSQLCAVPQLRIVP